MAAHAAPTETDQANALVQITGVRLAEYRAHRKNIETVFTEVESHIKALREADYPIGFERLDTQRAAITDSDGAKVMELRLSQLRPVMLYPTDHIQPPGGDMPMPGAQGGRGGMPGQPQFGPDEDDDDAFGFPDAEPEIPQRRRFGSASAKIIPTIGGGDKTHRAQAAGGAARGDGKTPGIPGGPPGKQPANDGERPGMTVEEIRAAAEDGPPPGTIMFDPSRGMPPSPLAAESLRIMTKSNIVGQPQEIEFIYDMTNPVRNMSFAAHIADVAAYLKDLHDRPAAERTGDNSPFAKPKQSIGFRPR